jgi:hypothetical protein
MFRFTAGKMKGRHPIPVMTAHPPGGDPGPEMTGYSPLAAGLAFVPLTVIMLARPRGATADHPYQPGNQHGMTSRPQCPVTGGLGVVRL